MPLSASSLILLSISIASFIPGAIGLILNIFASTRTRFRNNTCVLYFLTTTCFDLFIIFIVLPTRILSNSFSISLAYYNNGICKFENFIFNSSRSISCWLIAFACIDRFLNSCTVSSFYHTKGIYGSCETHV